MTGGSNGPVVFAYDGSELAGAAIDEAARQLGRSREALVLTVWQPFNVGFPPPPELELNAAQSGAVREAADRTAAEGAARARAAGFEARGLAVEEAPTWKGIIDVADEHDASLIVIGSRAHSGLADALIGSVARAVIGHSARPVLVIHRRP